MRQVYAVVPDQVKIPEGFQRLKKVLAGDVKPITRERYLCHLEALARYLNVPDVDAAILWLMHAGPLGGNSLVLAWLDSMRVAGLAPATVAGRLACLKSVLRKGRVLGLSAWSIEIRQPEVTPYRDTRGPEPDAVAQLIAAAEHQADPSMAARDGAMVRLLYVYVLRRGEVASLDLEHVDTGKHPSVWVLGKRRIDRVRIGLDRGTADAMAQWVLVRGRAPGALFHRLDRGWDGSERRRLDPPTLNLILRRLSWLATLPARVRPHGLRHAGITRFLDLTGDLRGGQRLARLRKLDTILHYDDNRRDLAGAAASQLALDMERLMKEGGATA